MSVLPLLQLHSAGVGGDRERLCKRPGPGGGGELVLYQLFN